VIQLVENTYYQCPAQNGAAWICEALSEIRQGIGEIEVELELAGGQRVIVLLEHVNAESGLVTVERGEQTVELQSAEIAGFRLIGDGPIDHSDELRG
jgi:hypothetical protein